jgi:uncharacterized membrane protein
MTAKFTKSEEQILADIIRLIKTKSFENAKELVDEIEKCFGLTEDKTMSILMDLEKEHRIRFDSIDFSSEKRVTHSRTCIFSNKFTWFWVSLSMITTGLITIFLPTSPPFIYMRYIFCFFFPFFLPGYLFVKALFPNVMHSKLSSTTLEVERLILIIGLSLTIISFLAIILNYTPWGVQITSLTLGVLLITIVCAIIAFARQFYEL